MSSDLCHNKKQINVYTESDQNEKEKEDKDSHIFFYPAAGHFSAITLLYFISGEGERKFAELACNFGGFFFVLALYPFPDTAFVDKFYTPCAFAWDN